MQIVIDIPTDTYEDIKKLISDPDGVLHRAFVHGALLDDHCKENCRFYEECSAKREMTKYADYN